MLKASVKFWEIYKIPANWIPVVRFWYKSSWKQTPSIALENKKKKKDGPALEAGMIAKRQAKIPFHSCRKRFIHNVLTPNRCTQAISQVTFDYHLSLEKRQRLKPNLRVFKLVKCSKSLCPAICQWCKLMDSASTSTTANRISQANPFIKWCPSIAAGRLPNRNQYKYFEFRA